MEDSKWNTLPSNIVIRRKTNGKNLPPTMTSRFGSTASPKLHSPPINCDNSTSDCPIRRKIGESYSAMNMVADAIPFPNNNHRSKKRSSAPLDDAERIASMNKPDAKILNEIGLCNTPEGEYECPESLQHLDIYFFSPIEASGFFYVLKDGTWAITNPYVEEGLSKDQRNRLSNLSKWLVRDL